MNKLARASCSLALVLLVGLVLLVVEFVIPVTLLILAGCGVSIL